MIKIAVNIKIKKRHEQIWNTEGRFLAFFSKTFQIVENQAVKCSPNLSIFVQEVKELHEISSI